MALYDVPTHTGFKILTHSSGRRFEKNGFSQVGNTTLPSHPINTKAVMPSSIFNKNLSLRGISQAGYGRRDPNYGLSYAGAGSPRASLRYAGAGSPRASLRYAGAGSPRTSLRDAYINDNPAPGTLRGLAEDSPSDVDTGSELGPSAPPPTPGFFDSIGKSFSTLLGTAVSAGTQAGQVAVQKSIIGSILPPATVAASPVRSTIAAAVKTTNILGMAIPTTALLVGGGVLAYFAFKK